MEQGLLAKEVSFKKTINLLFSLDYCGLTILDDVEFIANITLGDNRKASCKVKGKFRLKHRTSEIVTRLKWFKEESAR